MLIKNGIIANFERTSVKSYLKIAHFTSQLSDESYLYLSYSLQESKI